MTLELVNGPNACNSFTDAVDYATAEAYYTAGRKRLGLLECIITAAQCHFVSGVYEMYMVRPIKAWGSFNRACDVLQVYFRGSWEEGLSKGVVSQLYWSCLKSEWSVKHFSDLPAADN